MENDRNIRLKIVPKLGKIRVSKIRPMHLDAFYAELRRGGGADGGPLAPASVRKVHVILHAAFAQALKWGLLASTRPTLRPRRRRHRAGSHRRLRRRWRRRSTRIDELDPDFGVYLRLAATTGAASVAAVRAAVDRRRPRCRDHHVRSRDGRRRARVSASSSEPTKTGQIWKVSLAPATAKRLEDYRAVCVSRAESARVDLPG